MKAIIGGNSRFPSLTQVLTRLRQGYRLQKMCFHILLDICYHNIPTHTTHSWYLWVAKTVNLARMVEKCISRISARPTPLWAGGGGGSKMSKNMTNLIFSGRKL